MARIEMAWNLEIGESMRSPMGENEGMAKKQLTQRQLEALDWIGQGCPDKGWPDSYYKQSARMMEAYDLVKVSGHGSTWAAHITEKGRQQLAHGAEVSAGKPRKTDPRSATSTSTGKKVTANRQVSVVPVSEKATPAPWVSRVDESRRNILVPL